MPGVRSLKRLVSLQIIWSSLIAKLARPCLWDWLLRCWLLPLVGIQSYAAAIVELTDTERSLFSCGVFGRGLASTAVSAVLCRFFIALDLNLVIAFCLIWSIQLIQLFYICWCGA